MEPYIAAILGLIGAIIVLFLGERRCARSLEAFRAAIAVIIHYERRDEVRVALQKVLDAKVRPDMVDELLSRRNGGGNG